MSKTWDLPIDTRDPQVVAAREPHPVPELDLSTVAKQTVFPKSELDHASAASSGVSRVMYVPVQETDQQQLTQKKDRQIEALEAQVKQCETRSKEMSTSVQTYKSTVEDLQRRIDAEVAKLREEETKRCDKELERTKALLKESSNEKKQMEEKVKDAAELKKTLEACQAKLTPCEQKLQEYERTTHYTPIFQAICNVGLELLEFNMFDVFSARSMPHIPFGDKLKNLPDTTPHKDAKAIGAFIVGAPFLRLIEELTKAMATFIKTRKGVVNHGTFFNLWDTAEQIVVGDRTNLNDKDVTKRDADLFYIILYDVLHVWWLLQRYTRAYDFVQHMNSLWVRDLRNKQSKAADSATKKPKFIIISIISLISHKFMFLFKIAALGIPRNSTYWNKYRELNMTRHDTMNNIWPYSEWESIQDEHLGNSLVMFEEATQGAYNALALTLNLRPDLLSKYLSLAGFVTNKNSEKKQLVEKLRIPFLKIFPARAGELKRKGRFLLKFGTAVLGVISTLLAFTVAAPITGAVGIGVASYGAYRAFYVNDDPVATAVFNSDNNYGEVVKTRDQLADNLAKAKAEVVKASEAHKKANNPNYQDFYDTRDALKEANEKVQDLEPKVQQLQELTESSKVFDNIKTGIQTGQMVLGASQIILDVVVPNKATIGFWESACGELLALAALKIDVDIDDASSLKWAFCLPVSETAIDTMTSFNDRFPEFWKTVYNAKTNLLPTSLSFVLQHKLPDFHPISFFPAMFTEYVHVHEVDNKDTQVTSYPDIEVASILAYRDMQKAKIAERDAENEQKLEQKCEQSNNPKCMPVQKMTEQNIIDLMQTKLPRSILEMSKVTKNSANDGRSLWAQVKIHFQGNVRKTLLNLYNISKVGKGSFADARKQYQQMITEFAGAQFTNDRYNDKKSLGQRISDVLNALELIGNNNRYPTILSLRKYAANSTLQEINMTEFFVDLQQFNSKYGLSGKTKSKLHTLLASIVRVIQLIQKTLDTAVMAIKTIDADAQNAISALYETSANEYISSGIRNASANGNLLSFDVSAPQGVEISQDTSRLVQDAKRLKEELQENPNALRLNALMKISDAVKTLPAEYSKIKTAFELLSKINIEVAKIEQEKNTTLENYNRRIDGFDETAPRIVESVVSSKTTTAEKIKKLSACLVNYNNDCVSAQLELEKKDQGAQQKARTVRRTTNRQRRQRPRIQIV